MKTRLSPLAQAITLSALVGSLSAHADMHATTDADEVIVVTGTKTQRKLVDAPVRTEVITAEQLSNSHARDLAEGLKDVPGLSLVPIHGKTGQEVWIQGIDADRVLILIDGMPVSASTGSSVDLTQISVENVKQIEIVKGATSALHGSEAMGGVVNIITQRPTQPFGLRVTADGGSYGKHDVSNDLFNDSHLNVVTNAAGDNWFVQLAADRRNLGGSKLDPNSLNQEGADGHKSNLSFTAGYELPNGGLIKFSPSYYKEDVNYRTDESNPGFEPGWVKGEVAERSNINLSYQGHLTENTYLTTYYIHEQFQDDTHYSPLSSSSLSNQRMGKQSMDKAEAQLDFPIGDKHIITTGIVGFHSDLEQTKGGTSELTPTKPSRSNVEAYVQDDYFINNEWELLLGLRYQNDSDFGSHVAPKANLMYRPEALADYSMRIRAGVGTGYKVPTLKERYYVFDHSHLGYMVLGNAELQPESSVSYQLGADWMFSEALSADLNLFHNDIKDLISTDIAHDHDYPPELLIYQYTNTGRAFTQGAEAGFNYKPNSPWSGNLGYTYLRARDKDTNKHLTRRPEHQLKAKVAYFWDRINTSFALHGRYESDSFADSDNTEVSPAQTILDFKLNSWVTEQVKLFAGIDNLTNTVRETPSTGTDFRPTQGRFAYVGITYEY